MNNLAELHTIYINMVNGHINKDWDVIDRAIQRLAVLTMDLESKLK